jgi:hypothetical protein
MDGVGQKSKGGSTVGVGIRLGVEKRFLVIYFVLYLGVRVSTGGGKVVSAS